MHLSEIYACLQKIDIDKVLKFDSKPELTAPDNNLAKFV